MGVKGRRVHMIEEMSDTIISFQRGIVFMLITDFPWVMINRNKHFLHESSLIFIVAAFLCPILLLYDVAYDYVPI